MRSGRSSSTAGRNKIAVGYEREPYQFRQHLIAANGSCTALRTHLHVAAELGIIDNDQ